MLLSLTPNPAVDRTLIVPGFRSTDVCRVAEAHDAAGGKGLNVVRVARTLGTPVRACGLLGGQNGHKIATLATMEGIESEWAWLRSGESRTCLIVVDPAAPDTLVINERGPQIEAADWAALEALIDRMVPDATAVACSGSLPPGVAVEQLIGLLTRLASDRAVLLDTSGAALAAALDLPLSLLKVNAEELGDALGYPIRTLAEAQYAAAQVQARGPHAVVVTLGKEGAVAVDQDGAWWARPPQVESLSAVGSGDAVLAGIASAMLDKRSLAEALRLGVACGAANTLMVGGGVLRLVDVEALQASTLLVGNL